MISFMKISLYTCTFVQSSFRDNTTLSGEKMEHKALSRELYVSTHKYCLIHLLYREKCSKSANLTAICI